MKSPIKSFASISKKLLNNEGWLLAMGSGGLRCLALSTSILKCSLSIWQRRVMDPSTNSPAFTSLCFLYLSLRYLEITRGYQWFFLHTLLLKRIYSPILPPLKNRDLKEGRPIYRDQQLSRFITLSQRYLCSSRIEYTYLQWLGSREIGLTSLWPLFFLKF